MQIAITLNGYLIVTGIFFLTNCIAEIYLKSDFRLSLLFIVWCLLAYIGIFSTDFYVLITGVIYLIAFVNNIKNQKHLPIILSGAITVWATNLLTHDNAGYIFNLNLNL